MGDAGRKNNDAACDTEVGSANAKDKKLEATEEKSDAKEKKPTVPTNSMGKKGDKSKVVQSRKHSVKSFIVKPLHIAKGGKVEELLEEFLKQTLPEKGTKEEEHTSKSETRMTQQDKKDENRERRRIARAKRESLKDFQAPKSIVLGFSCVVKKINRDAIKAVLVDPQFPQNLLQILHPLALDNSLPVIRIENLGPLTKNILGFKVSALGLCDHPKSCSLYSKLLESVLGVDTSKICAHNFPYQKTKLE